MKELYIITDLDGEVVGQQTAGFAARAVALFAKKNNLMEHGLKAVGYQDFQPIIVAGFEPVEDENAWIESDRKNGYMR